MAWKPWYEQLAEMNNESEKQEFMKGVFFSGSGASKGPVIAGLVAGYLGVKLAKKKYK